MEEVYKNIFVGTDSDCFHGYTKRYVVIHACKIPCHQFKLKYSANLPRNHPNYLFLEDKNHLYLNLEDNNRFIPEYTDPVFSKAMNFIQKHIEDRKVLIHCNLGQSRSAAIAFVYMAKNNLISKETYTKALTEFKKIYPLFSPSIGISSYLQSRWNILTK